MSRSSASPAPGPRSLGGTLGALAGLVAGGLYLLNLGAGVIEFLPDNLPLLGNLDEAGATALVIACLRYLLQRRSTKA